MAPSVCLVSQASLLILIIQVKVPLVLNVLSCASVSGSLLVDMKFNVAKLSTLTYERVRGVQRTCNDILFICCFTATH